MSKWYFCSQIKFDIDKIQPIKNSTYKPLGGVWVTKNKYDWVEWCKNNNYIYTNKFIINEIELNNKANVLTINTVNDLKYILYMDDINDKGIIGPDYEAMSRKYDGIYLTENMLLKNRYNPKFGLKELYVYTWDLASMIILNKNIIIEESIKEIETAKF